MFNVCIVPAPSVQRLPSETRNVLYIGEDVSVTCISNVTGVVFTWRAINALNRQPVVISNVTTHPTPHSSVFKPTVVDAVIVDVFCSVMIAGNDNIATGEAFSLIQIIGKIQHSTISTKKILIIIFFQYQCGVCQYPPVLVQYWILVTTISLL